MEVALAGYGQEGESSFKYWKSLGANITIFDEKQPTREIPEGTKTYFEQDAFSKMNDFDFVIRTAGLNPNNIKTNSKIWSATNEFFKQCTAPIIGVTGTKGKGTTASLIAEILKQAGETVHLLGNIGIPALGELAKIKPTDIVVFELSSFQLWDLEKSPETAVVLMIEADHVDVHASMEEYINAKANIGLHQTEKDLLIYHPTNTYSAKIASRSSAQKKRYSTPEGAYVSDGSILIEENTVCSVDEVSLIGAHNLENICAAVTAAWDCTQNIAAIRKAVIEFTGLPHRLEVVAQKNGVTYIDDSFSSAPGAAIAAIKSFTQPEILICGGYDRDLDFTDLAIAISEQQNVKKIILIGQTNKKIADALDKVGVDSYQVIETKNFSEIIKIAIGNAEEGDVIVLSPGCASFDMFKDFKDRSDQFQKIVKEL